ncbi:MAG: SMP-30/gluconolactonase/LRE family protein [Ferrovibrio sp.]|uniref:SMP-30/gluconolactonase/LRE family protein n=1 Tax=Ferrovibrio sp. TaxID=1917215 RepID=UPI0026020621|nr:SMP-30/gluconolactonase/LRE family protein [Ferrovibrio sp.]MCW0236588.1 SMP-30/gluconolactonase/LRE family protein [Ferrovibrio sp.]
MDATCLLDGKFDLAESPVWSVAGQTLWFVDINAPALHRLDPATLTLETWKMPAAIGCIALMQDGGVIAARRDGIWRLDLAGGPETLLAPSPLEAARFNDGRCDRQGRFWVGGMTDTREPETALYRLDGASLPGRLTRQGLVGAIATSNALAWSPDGATLYHADTPTHCVFAYDYDAKTAAISNRRLFLDLRDSGERPDGAAVDSAGNYWVALYGAGRVVQFSPVGERLRDVHLPVKAPTMPCFGGPDLKTLYITTARQKHDADELAKMPLAGGIFSVRVDIPGLPETPFAG